MRSRIFEKLANSRASVVAASSRLVAVGAMFATAAIMARQYRGEYFGFWSVLLTVPGFSALAAMGVNAGGTNRLVAMKADVSSAHDARRFFCSMLYMQLASCSVLSLLAVVVMPHVDWAQALQITEENLMGRLEVILGGATVLSLAAIPFQNSYGSVLTAFHRVHQAAVLMAVQNVILFAFVAIAVGHHSFEVVVLGYFTLNLILVIIFLAISMRSVGWTIQWVGIGEIRRDIIQIIKPSGEFWVLNISSTLITVGQTALVAFAGGVAAAGSFNLLQRLFSLLVTLHLAFIAPWAPIYTQRAVRGEWEQLGIQNRELSFIKTPLMILGAGIPIAILHPMILHFWTGTSYQNYTLAVLLLIWVTLAAVGNSLSVLLNSLGHFRSQAVLGVITALIFAGGFSLLHVRWGVVAIPISTIVSLAIGVGILQWLVSSVCREKRISV